jgi:hypothetical protein
MVSNKASATGNAGYGSTKDKGKKAADESDVNLEEILNEISRSIFNIYKNNINPHADANAARNPLDILTEIESVMERAMLEINHIEEQDPDLVGKNEKERKGIS